MHNRGVAALRSNDRVTMCLKKSIQPDIYNYIKKSSDLCCLEVWMEVGAAESGTGLLRAFENGGDPFNYAILLMCTPGMCSIGGLCPCDTRKDFPLWPNTQFLVWPHGWLLFVLETPVDV